MQEILMKIIRLLSIFFFLSSSSPKQLLAIGNNNTDYKSLIAFKNQFLKQGNGASSAIFMASWNDTNNFCSWEGVTCGRKHSDRVTALDLNSCGLLGPLPPSIANLSFLIGIDLSNNSLYGEIPPNLARLPRLQHLNLSFNSFHGDIGALFMTNNSVLQAIDLGNNQLTGKIPPFINSVSFLNFLGLDNNHIIGSIPPSLGNLSVLQSFYALANHLEGSIPPEIGGLCKLRELKLAENNLSGNIPSSFYNLSSLRKFSVAANHLSGKISTDIAQAFPYLKGFSIADNNFIGSLDRALQNVTSLIYLDVGINNFAGVVPPDLGKMHNLVLFDIEYNKLEASDTQDWRFLDSLTNCTGLRNFHIHHNNFGGVLPKSIRNLSTDLQMITLGSNYISGSIPFELDRYTNLIALGMEINFFEGPIPKSIGKLTRLQFLSFEGNRLTGIIPDSLGNLTTLNTLGLGFNQLIGSIPSNLNNIRVLSKLDLSHNNLTSLIPKELFLLTSLSYKLDLSFNSFSGTLPLEIGHLTSLVVLDFSNNNLTGEIPKSLGSCQLLLKLNMENNLFYGSIPISLSNIKNLEMLDISHNNLSGKIPQSLQNLTFLNLLNLSFNKLEGEVPYEGVFANSSIVFLIGNEKLCGGNPKFQLPKCVVISPSIKTTHRFIKIVAPIVTMLVLLLIILLWYTLLYRKRKQSDHRRNSFDSSLSTPFSRISYAKLSKATNGFSSSYLVGYGRYGSVYKGTIREYQGIVAIKVFKLDVHGAFKSFTTECNSLRSIRHRNLIRVLTSCSSIDHQGRDFKALIFEFMPKGNLDTWLHKEYETSGDDVLSLEKRLNIAINVGDALEYLHHSCNPPIIHCDIKPSNILLDNNMIAHVGDFGLSRIFSEAINMPFQDYSDKSEIKGTIGYVAPEYGEGARPSISADVYSFGIIVLEILTGRRPTDDIFKDNLNIHNHVKMVFPQRINSIIDLKMFTEEHRDADYSSYQRINKCLLSLAEVHGAFKSFTSECDALRSIRHRNLVRILTTCSSIDHQGRDFKALIFEFMLKGNLDMWLHQKYETSGDDILSLEKRLNIIINVADALEFLHRSCEPSIIHCDMKPCNILLDNNMIAHIVDFGLSRIFSEAISLSLKDYSDESEIKGTIGYITPEYGEGAHPSTSADVYSFGIILLEILTGRRPMDHNFKDNLNIHNQVKMAFPHRINDIIDLKMFIDEQRDVDPSNYQHVKKCLLSLAEIGLSCSTSLPEERPCMRDVANDLHTIKAFYLQYD